MYNVRVIYEEIMENLKALLNFDVFGWFTAIIQIQIGVLCK